MSEGGEPYVLLRMLARPRAAVRRRVPVVWRRRLAVFVGGAAGTGLRATITGVVPVEAGAFPWSVWAVNVSGSLVLGYLATRFLAAGVRSTLTMPLVGIGLLGSYTTFSTFAVDVVKLAEASQATTAAAYAVASLVAGLAAAWLGIRLAQARA